MVPIKHQLLRIRFNKISSFQIIYLPINKLIIHLQKFFSIGILKLGSFRFQLLLLILSIY
jgi:hypothetical protein